MRRPAGERLEPEAGMSMTPETVGPSRQFGQPHERLRQSLAHHQSMDPQRLPDRRLGHPESLADLLLAQSLGLQLGSRSMVLQRLGHRTERHDQTASDLRGIGRIGEDGREQRDQRERELRPRKDVAPVADLIGNNVQIGHELTQQAASK